MAVRNYSHINTAQVTNRETNLEKPYCRICTYIKFGCCTILRNGVHEAKASSLRCWKSNPRSRREDLTNHIWTTRSIDRCDWSTLSLSLSLCSKSRSWTRGFRSIFVGATCH